MFANELTTPNRTASDFYLLYVSRLEHVTCRKSKVFCRLLLLENRKGPMRYYHFLLHLALVLVNLCLKFQLESELFQLYVHSKEPICKYDTLLNKLSKKIRIAM